MIVVAVRMWVKEFSVDDVMEGVGFGWVSVGVSSGGACFEGLVPVGYEEAHSCEDGGSVVTEVEINSGELKNMWAEEVGSVVGGTEA